MSIPDFQLYGDITGFPEEALDSVQSQIGEVRASFESGVLRIDHEGFAFAEDVLEAVIPHLEDNAEGKIDYVDRQEWTLTRYRVSGREWTRKIFNLNEVLDAHRPN